MTTGTPDFNTALQMAADWMVWLDEKEAELDAKIAKSGGGGAAATSEPLGVRGMDAGGTNLSAGVPAPAGGRVLPFSPFDEDAPADLPVVVPVADPGWLPPAEPKAVAAQMLDVSDTPDPLGEDDSPGLAETDTDEAEDDAGAPGQLDDLDDPFADDKLDAVASRPPDAQSGRRASEPDADGDEDTQAEDFRQAMQPGPARPPVIINQAPAPRPPSASKPPIPAPRPSSPVARGAADLPVLAVEPATDPLDALETPWGAEAAPGLAKRKRRVLPDLIEF
jgi:hypothetical protein